MRHVLLLILMIAGAAIATNADAGDDGSARCSALLDRARSLASEEEQEKVAEFRRTSREAFDICRAADVPAGLKADAYLHWANQQKDRKTRIAVLAAGVAELERKEGADNPALVPLLQTLGLEIAAEPGRRTEGTGMLERALALQQKRYGAISEQAADAQIQLAYAASMHEDNALAEHHLRRAIDVAREACGPECQTLALALYSLADVVKRDAARTAEAEALFDQSAAAHPKQSRAARRP
jgi:hypothetical protein